MIHFMIYPLFLVGLDAMKYIVNHHDRFDYPVVAYFISFIFSIQVFTYEIAVILILFYIENIPSTLGAYFSVTALVQLQQLYYNQVIEIDSTDILKEVFLPENLPKYQHRNKEFGKRTHRNKVGWVIYKFMRGFYASAIFYFFPSIFLLGHIYLF